MEKDNGQMDRGLVSVAKWTAFVLIVYVLEVSSAT